jgi:KDO2-lipid IV(A) lauroyltransferase
VSGLVYSLGSVLVRLLPAGLVYRGAALFGTLSYLARPALRRQTLANYAPILKRPPEDPEVKRVARAAMVGYSKLIVDFLLMPHLSREGVLRMVDPVGLDRLRKAVDGGKGAIVVTPHFGNWDLAAATAAALGYPVTIVTERFGPAGMDRKVVAARQRLGLAVVPLSVRAGKASLTALRRGEIVGLVCDLPKEGRNLLVTIAGQRALVPAGPALLSLRSGAPIVPIVNRRVADGHYRLDVLEPLTWPASADAERDMREFAQAIIDRFEPALRANPEQWYLFSPMWGKAETEVQRPGTPAIPPTAMEGAGRR